MFVRWLTAAALVIVTVSGCAGFHRGEYWDGSTETSASDEEESEGPDDTDGGSTGAEAPTGAPESLSFVADVLPLLEAGCERCHASNGEASDTSFLLDVDDLDAYEMTLGFVDLDEPIKSPLLTKGAGQGHGGGVIYDEHDAEHAAILEWIEQGALP